LSQGEIAQNYVSIFEYAEFTDLLASSSPYLLRPGVCYALGIFGETEERIRLAQDVATSASILQWLSRVSNVRVRWFVAMHSKASESALWRLSRDADWEVRYEVATNPHSPAALLEVLATDANVNVRERVAQNANTPVSVLGAISQGRGLGCANVGGWKPPHPVPPVALLLNDGDGGVRFSADISVVLS
jgi:hypothetical protein